MLAELDSVAGTTDWLAAQRRCSIREVLPGLLLRLERLATTDLEPGVRLELLRLYKRPVLEACAALPKPDPSKAHGGFCDTTGLTSEQRLDRVMRLNLNRLVQELDRKRYQCAVSTEDNRLWVLRNLFKFLRRQVRYSLLAARPCPPQTWQELHDLFVYLVIRGNVRLESSTHLSLLDDGFEPETEYKRLLLMGFAQQSGVTGPPVLDLLPRLRAWACESRLSDPGVHQGQVGLMLVEVSQDRPMRVKRGSLEQDFRGWVMQPAAAYVRFVDRAAHRTRRRDRCAA